MDYILHIDTSTDTSTVAVSSDGALLSIITNEEIRNHAATINNMIADALEKANITINELCAVSVVSGPGSYTGLRIAMATAKGICYAIDKPLIMNDRLSLLAYNATQNIGGPPHYIATILTAREKEYFIGIYNNEHVCILTPVHITEEELPVFLQGKENLHIIADIPEGTFYQLKVNFLSFNANIKLDINSCIECAYIQYNRQGFVNISNATPLYLKQVYTHK